MDWIILIGMMGCGKSTVGMRLAEQLDIPFKDTDQVLQYRLGRPVHQLFELYGEEAFRQHETRVLEQLAPEPGVLATGGGIVLKEDNWTQMKRLGTTIFLNVTDDVVLERLRVTKRRRPLLETDNWEERFLQLKSARMPLYRQADYEVIIDSEEFEDVIARIKQCLNLS